MLSLLHRDAAADFSLPPSSILNVLATAVPTSVLGELDNLSAISAWAYGLASSIENGQTPGWVASLPPSVKSYLYTAYVTETGAAAPTVTAASTGGMSTSPATATVTSVSESSSGSSAGATSASTGSAASAASSVASAVSSAASAASSAAAAGSSTSTGGAPAATGALAVGLTGAVGVLGLALAL